MKTLYQTYFAGVRWVELGLVVAVAALADLQLKVQDGKHLERADVIEALGKGIAAAWVYLRVPKAPDAPPSEVHGSLSLPEGIDATGPRDDIEQDAVVKVVEALLPPGLSAASPELAKNIVSELKRVLRRGIRL